VNETRNMILAVVLSALVLLGWSALSNRLLPPTSGPQTQTVDKGKVKPLPQPGADPGADGPRAMQSRAAVLGSSPRVRIDTPNLKGSLNLQGARIDDLRLSQHKTRLGKDAPLVRLLSPAGGPNAYFAGFGWLGEGGAQVPDANTVWQASSRLLAPGKPVTLNWTNPTGQRFELTYAVDEGYLFTVRQRVVNAGAGPVAVRPYALLSRSAKSIDPSSWTHHVGPMAYLNGAANYDLDWETLDEAGSAGKSFGSNGGWLGFTDKYWLTALAPAGSGAIDASFRRSGVGGYQADYAGAPQIVAAGEALASETRLFAGAKEKKWLDAYEAAGITKLSKSIDWGWFEWFMRPIFVLLVWLFNTLGNFGVAIIALTFIVRLLMYPVFDRQFRSMAAMRTVQPKLKAIQDKHKDDKVRLQQEMLELYKREKINPAAGCLPIFLQIPVFYALYKVLTVAVEMRHQPFVAWLKDLSAPDPLTPLNLFGLLPFQPSGMLALGVLPILLGVTMWLQMKLNPAPLDPTQAQIMKFMPIVMTFAFTTFGAGLQLYYVVSNILGIIQQKWLYSRYNVDADTVPAKAVT
jgi:YidC/Oxa1 family membrane protein insertase